MPKTKKGLFLLPCSLTTAGLLVSLYAIYLAHKGEFTSAILFVFLAMIFDALDGRVARLTNSETAFGEQYDSLADLVSFGITPAILAYLWGLSSAGTVGLVASAFYIITTALRLARFNTQIGIEDKNFFQGLPSPAAAALVVSMVGTFDYYGMNVPALTVIFLFLSGGLMVSGFRYRTFKGNHFKERVPLKLMLAILMLLMIVLWQPTKVLFIISSSYVFYGIVETCWRVWHTRKKNKKAAKKSQVTP